MTAEVAILSKDAVALAADSAATVGTRKIYNTVNKVFALDKRHPVGVMIYSSAEVMGVPVETVIKEFRRRRGVDQRSTLPDYAGELEDFLKTDNTIFDDNARLGSLKQQIESLTVTLHQAAFENVPHDKGWGQPNLFEAKGIPGLGNSRWPYRRSSD